MRFVRSVFLVTSLALALPACGGDLSGRDPADAGTTSRDAAALGDAALDGSLAPDGGAVSTCSEGRPRGALAFDGVDDGVTMGVAPGLGLARFTVEAWVRRDGPGVPMSTGVGGLSIVPIAGKGRGENDRDVYNCNYAFGFVGDVLGADFEDSNDGTNHPVLGQTRVTPGEWHHVAATYDGTTWRLYLDGVLDAETRAGARPRADSIQHFGVGTALNSAGVAAGRLHGAVAEVRVWNRARSEAEIAESRFRRIESADGLVGRWSFHEAEGGATDTAGDHDGTIRGATWTDDGPVLEEGLPPRVTGLIPSDGVEVTGESVALTVGVADPDDAEVEVAFHVRAVPDDEDFTIVVLPDTQYYTVESRALHRYFYDQTQWIVDNRDAYNIRAVIHNGDIVNNGDREDYQWRIADRAMSTLEGALPGFPDGIPFAVAVGNHDLSVVNEPGVATKYNQYFGVARFEGRTYYGGHYDSTNDESWFTFSAGGIDFVVVNMKFAPEPSAAVLAWARQILRTHPDHFGIVNAHYILTGAGNFSPQGRAIYEALRDVPNLHLMTCGHVSNEQRRTDTFEGHSITSMLADYQSRDDGGSGYMRIWEMSPANGEMTVRTYSPTLDTWETDANSEFTLRVPLRTTSGTFDETERVGRVTSTATVTIEGLEPGRAYEWYATVRDCAHTVRTPVTRFTAR